MGGEEGKRGAVINADNSGRVASATASDSSIRGNRVQTHPSVRSTSFFAKISQQPRTSFFLGMEGVLLIQYTIIAVGIT
jgi:hypothetical protein